MDAVTIADFITLVSNICTLLILLILWKKNLSNYTKIIFGVLVSLITFHSLSNFLEWADFTNFLDPYEDFLQVLEPILWFTLIFAYLQEISKGKLRKSERKLRENYNRAEFYKDVFAHDVNNILQNILSSAELCELFQDKPNKPNQMKEIMQNIEYQVSRGARLVNNIRTLSDLEEYKSEIEPIEFTPILEDVIRNLREKNKERNIEIQINNQNKENLILANDRLREVFENILINAIIHNENPKIDIVIGISREIREAKKYVKFEILDNGPGIFNGEKSSIFKREYKLDKSLTGKGLGLVIVKKIIDAYNGQIWVEDKVKGDYTQGSNFILLIPEAV